MNIPAFTKFCLALGFAAAWGAAGADVNKCIDPQGHTLYTDQPCADGRKMEVINDSVKEKTVSDRTVDQQLDDSSGADSHNAGSSDSGSVGIVITTSMEHASPTAPAPSSPWATLPHPLPKRTVALDTSTLQAAHEAMLMDDEMRHQRKKELSMR